MLWVSVLPVSYFPNSTWFRYIPFRYARMRYTRFCTPVINVEHVAHDHGAIRRHKEWLPTYEMVVSPWVCLNGMMTRLQKKTRLHLFKPPFILSLWQYPSLIIKETFLRVIFWILSLSKEQMRKKEASGIRIGVQLSRNHRTMREWVWGEPGL